MGTGIGAGAEGRHSAVERISSDLPATQRMDLLVELALTAANRADRNEAAQGLQEFGSAAVLQLEHATHDSYGGSEKHREALVEALRIMASSIDEAYTVLTHIALHDSSATIRRAAGYSIASSRVGLDAAEAGLQHPQEQVRLNAVDVLGKFFEDGVPGLKLAIQDLYYEQVRLHAVQALGNMTMFCDDPLSVLKQAQQDPSERVRAAACFELAKKGHRPMGTPSED